MSNKEFEKVNSIIGLWNQQNEIEARQAKIASEEKEKQRTKDILQRIKRDEQLLEEWGVKALFEKIRDSGLVKLIDSPVYKEVPKYKTTMFGRKIIDHYDRQKVKDYYPAMIYQSNPSSDLNNIRHQNPGKPWVYIYLEFDQYTSGSGDGENTFYKQVRIAVVDNKLQLACKSDYVGDIIYKPIEEGKLGDTVASAIKNPLL